MLFSYKGDYIYQLITATGRLIQVLSVQFIAEKRGFNNIGVSKPLAKRQYLLIFPVYPAPNL